jgi:hypothetical protein
MTKAKAPKAVKITAPKIASAWAKVCATSAKSENEIIASIENLSAVMVLESGLSVRDVKKVVSDTGKESAFIRVSHVSALPTWSKLRAKHADFKALPLSKQLSTAMASYDILGAGKGEQISTLDALTKEIATIRKAKQTKSDTPKSDTPSKAKKNALADMLAYFNALDFASLSESDQDLISDIHATLESKMISA